MYLKVFTHFTYGNICLGFLGSQSSIRISAVPCLMLMSLQCHFKKSQDQLLTVGRKTTHLMVLPFVKYTVKQ